jgi:hypothetical protein
MDDKDLERRLRDEFGRNEWGAAVDSPSLEQVSRRMGRRRTVRRAVVAVGLLGVVVAGAATTVSLVGDDSRPGPETNMSDQSARVPWLDAKSDEASLAPCSLDDLDVELGDSGAWHGQTIQGIDFTNAGTTACNIGGVPTVRLFSPSGEAVPVDAAGVDAIPLTLAPGDTADLVVGAPASCAPSTGSDREIAKELSVRLNANASPTRLSGAWVSLVCGKPKALWFENEGCYDSACNPLGKLEATIDAPAIVEPGEVIDYTVTLTNPSDTDIRFDAYCPTYSESVVDATTHGKRFANDVDYLLNCAAAPFISAHDSVAFVMRIQVPPDASDQAILDWTLYDRDSVSASARARIQGD